MKKRSIFLSLLICIAAAFFACGIFAISNTKDKGHTVTAEAATAITPTIYWRYDSSNTTLSIGSVQLTGGTASGSFSGDTVYTLSNPPPWTNYSTQITLVNIETPIAPKSLAAWFIYCCKLTTVNNMNNIDTSLTIAMNNLFQECSSLQSIDLSTFDTSNVEKMFAMFMGCSSLQSVNVSNWNTSNVDNFANMFNGCSLLTSIDVSSFDTSNATILGSMFKNCSSLTSIDVSNFDTSKTQRMGEVFRGCSSLISLDLSGFNALSLLPADGGSNSGITDFFNGCTSLEKVKLTNSFAYRISTDGNTAMPSMYYQDGTYCTNQSQVTNGGGYFKTPHTHSYPTITETKLATCGADGYDKYDCAELFCTAPKIITYAATGIHSWDSGTVTQASTCTTAGKKLFNCTACTTTKTEDLPLSAHTYSSVWKHDATNHWHECSVCNAVEPNSTEAHNGGTADCKNKAQCSVCNQEYGSYGAHTEEVDAAVPATCTTAGKTEGKHCSTCTTVITAQTVVPALGHDWGAWHETVAATEQAEGEEQRECQRSGCTEVETKLIPKTNHVHVEEVDAAVDPTCTTAGKTEGKHCSACGMVLVAPADIPALGHDWATVWSKDTTNHWHECTVCHEKNDEAAHTYDWVITKEPTEDEEGEKEEYCTVCDYANGNKETLAKLIIDDNGSVSDLPKLPDNQDYDLEIAVKESESKYNIEGLNKGYLVELFIVDGEERNPYDDSKEVTLTLLVPEGMDDFTLYRMNGDRLTEISEEEYTVSGGIVTIRTTLPSEFVFNAPIPEQPSAGIPWWVWLLVVLGSATLLAIIIVIIVVAKKKKNDGNNGGDTEELKAQLAEQGEKIDELLGRDDGGFNTPVELDENGNVIFK